MYIPHPLLRSDFVLDSQTPHCLFALQPPPSHCVQPQIHELPLPRRLSLLSQHHTIPLFEPVLCRSRLVNSDSSESAKLCNPRLLRQTFSTISQLFPYPRLLPISLAALSLPLLLPPPVPPFSPSFDLASSFTSERNFPMFRVSLSSVPIPVPVGAHHGKVPIPIA
ncbi:hypothetical protein NDA14_000271 [Ustilago hordei]|uniref:Uncharacterized protein n=1 Tax=Ustilago hordei TaxID=120017 RepID=I2FUS8_USTHO|nr:uncharacterized protein UHO2_07267 [Ustilago hordei]KAJ1040790.1 hypothetical protein NDA10_005111 [Ustilago hordei]KAJ1576480.1 hypothetical protein NDA12_005623 [Ustilago hordei]KAJ1577940.1 hypothetical protein NDA15_007533 [Ustilago hordei]KAJ1598751.1 hypothetical protein NDA14_000271 [Ustilago hordei]UTT90488.1 hypothetical protein NDA17_007227 [Ustilago hordei]